MSDTAKPSPATPAVSAATKREPEVREQKVRDRRGNVKTIRVKILRGGQRATPPNAA